MFIGFMPYCPKPTTKIIKVGKPKGKEACIHRVIYLKEVKQ